MELQFEKIKEIFSQAMGNYIVYEQDETKGLRPIWVTDGIPEMLGYTREEFEQYIQSVSLAEFWGFDEKTVELNLQGLFKKEENPGYISQMGHKKKGYIWIKSRSRVIGTMDGKTIVSTELIDIDSVSSTMNRLLDQSEQIIFIMATDSLRLLYVNDKYLEVANTTREYALSKCCYDVCPYSEKQGKACEGCMSMKAYLEGGSVEAVKDNGNSFYHIDTKKIEWGGHEAYYVSVTDISEERLAEKERLEKYYNRIHVSLSAISGSYRIYFINLTQNTSAPIEFAQSGDMGIQRPYDEGLTKITERIASEESKQEVLQKLSRENLLQAFQDGLTKFTIYTVFSRNEEEDTYFRITAYLRQNPITRDVEATLQLEDVTEEHTQDCLVEYMMNNAYDTIAVIDMKHHRFQLLKEETQLFETDKYTLSNSRNVFAALIDKRIIDDEKKMFERAGSLEVIRRKLSQNKSYSIMAHTKQNDGSVAYQRFTYALLEKDRQNVVLTSEDVTEDFEIDRLTGLFNYNGFIVRAREMIQNTNKNYVILYFNIKGFKAVNELFGNEAGDKVLQNMTFHLKNSAMKPALIGRVAVTDHFICLAEDANVMFEEIKNLCHIHMIIDEKKVSIHGRCGIYLVQDRNMSVERMCDQAKIAKQNIQDDYVKPYAVFDEKMREAYLSKSSAVTVVSQALENEEFCVYFQPIYDGKTGKLASAEALVRWNRPGIGIVSPGLFVPALEENGYISLVDRFVARKVRDFQDRMLQEYGKTVPISVNLSWIDFYDENMMKSVMEDIESETGRMGFLRYEVTETSWAAMNSKSSSALRFMKEHGIKILLDDFGSGFSSFSTIRDYDFDILKIDMGFVQKLGVDGKVDGIICAIIDMAHRINATVVAEGVETEAQRQFLSENHCDYLQGYLFSKPLPEEDFVRLVREKRE